ncbi:MAG: hypothetical protein IKU82_02765 [Clostridia bacterium]|nr:hypothetical protein [Clostridia bacterium]
MTRFIVALLFGAGQICLTEQLIYAFNKRDGKKTLLFFAAKFLAYAIGVGFVILKDILNINYFVYGFVVGIPLAAIALFVYKTIYKK